MAYSEFIPPYLQDNHDEKHKRMKTLNIAIITACVVLASTLIYFAVDYHLSTLKEAQGSFKRECDHIRQHCGDGLKVSVEPLDDGYECMCVMKPVVNSPTL